MREASSLLQQSNVTRYMEKVTWRLNQEESRAHKYLDMSSIPKVRSRSSCESGSFRLVVHIPRR